MSVHEDIRLDLPAYLKGELDDARAAEVARHLDECNSCLRARAELEQVVRALESAPLEYEPPEHLSNETVALIELEHDVTGETGAEKSGPVSMPVPAASSARRGSPWMLAAAALAIAVLVLGVTSIQLLRRVDVLEATISAEQGQVDRTVDNIEFASKGPGDVDASAELRRGRDNYNLVMWADGLPVTTGGHHYEVWFWGKDGWASAGSFQVPSPRDLTWHCPVGVDPRDYPKLWVTLEPGDGDPRPTGPSVLEATIAL